MGFTCSKGIGWTEGNPISKYMLVPTGKDQELGSTYMLVPTGKDKKPVEFSPSFLYRWFIQTSKPNDYQNPISKKKVSEQYGIVSPWNCFSAQFRKISKTQLIPKENIHE